MRTRRSGVSDVLTSLILVLTSVSLATVFFFWALGYLNQSQSSIGLGISQGGLKVQEQFALEGVRFCTTSGTPSLAIYVRNFDDVAVTVDHVYLNGLLYTAPSSGSYTMSPNTPLVIVGRSVQSMTVTQSGLWSTNPTQSNHNVNVEVASTRGNTFQQSYTAPLTSVSC